LCRCRRARQLLEGGHVLYSEPRKIVFTGLVVGAVAIGVGAYVSQTDEDWLPSDELGVTHGGATAGSARGSTMSGVVTSGPVEGHGDSATARANSLNAARNSLLRDDVAAARAQLNAISPAHQDDQQVLALQREIQARADREQRAVAAAQVDNTPLPAQQAVPTTLSGSVKGGHSRGAQRASREYLDRASGYARNRRHAGTLVTKAGSAGASVANVAAVGAAPTASQSAYAPPVANVVREPGALAAPPLLQQSAPASEQESTQPVTPRPAQEVQSTTSTPPVVTTAPPASLPPVVQATVPSGSLLKSDGPKTRAQVRAEIAHARQDGSLPAFGNPDPAGPGGAPSLTIEPRP
jgi:hypothetical protein